MALAQISGAGHDAAGGRGVQVLEDRCGRSDDHDLAAHGTCRELVLQDVPVGEALHRARGSGVVDRLRFLGKQRGANGTAGRDFDRHDGKATQAFLRIGEAPHSTIDVGEQARIGRPCSHFAQVRFASQHGGGSPVADLNGRKDGLAVRAFKSFDQGVVVADVRFVQEFDIQRDRSCPGSAQVVDHPGVIAAGKRVGELRVRVPDMFEGRRIDRHQ